MMIRWITDIWATCKRRTGRRFTLIELLVVVAIIAVLAAMLLPALGRAKQQVVVVQCGTIVRSLAIANSQYGGDNGEFSVHGIDMAYAWPGSVTGYGRNYFNTNIFDDDWGSGKPGTPGRNPASDGAQNICGVGQLMLGNYIEPRAEAIACPSAGMIEPTGYAWNMTTMQQVQTALKRNWRAEYYTGNDSYEYNSTTYVVRGPLLRITDGNPARTAIFADHEQAKQTIIPWVGAGGSPLPYWPRRHRPGVNVAYNDGHAAFFNEPNRAGSYWKNQTYNYGNGFALQAGYYDVE